ncbi:MAG: pilus assembly protein PilP [Thiotrichaceae bacterium]
MIIKKYGISTLLRLVTVTAIATSLTGCNGSKQEELEGYLESVKNRAAKPIAPIPVIKPYLRFVYPEQDVDPFDVSILAPVVSAISEVRRVDNGVEVDTTRIPEFLEGFPLDSLRMVGTVHRKGELWGLVKIPDGGIQRVKKGDYLGKNFGKVNVISEAKINLEEIVPNGFGGYKPRVNAIALMVE